MKSLILTCALLCALASVAQTARTVNANAQEFPAVLLQSVEAGKTAPGTSVSARLMMGTLFNGVVIPEGALLSGVVEESVARSGNAPARLRVHLTQAEWKERTMALNLYLSDQYYPKKYQSSSENQHFDASNTDAQGIKLETHAVYSGGKPERETLIRNVDPASSLKSADSLVKAQDPATVTAGRPGRMKMAAATAVSDDTGALSLVSEARKLKLDRDTCYSFVGAVPRLESGAHSLK